ncbi:MAG: ABC transporter substrate-binding protein [Clostridia bacterium]|nr:ABC transporter substrate-binding protein [Clostridia bacterium]
MKKIINAVVLCAAILISTVCCATPKKDTTTTIRLNEVTHSVFYAPLYLAIEKGFFKDEGVEIELTNGGGADKVMTALLSNGADIGLMGVEATIYVVNEGKKDSPKVFAQLTKRDGSFLISRKEEPDFKWEDLEGKTIIAGRTGGVPAMTFEYVVNKHGLFNGTNVTLNNEIAFNMMGPSFESGVGDYTTLFEPTASEYQNAGKGFIVASVGKESGEIPYTAFTALDSYLQNNKDTVKKFVRAMYKAIKHLAETDEKTVAESIVGQFPSTPVSSIENALKSYKKIDAWMTDMQMTESALDNLQTVMQNAGELKEKVSLDKIADNQFAIDGYKEVYA